jgi:hypothetical protein
MAQRNRKGLFVDFFHQRTLPVLFWLAFLALGFFTSFGQSSGTRPANEAVSPIAGRRSDSDNYTVIESP